MAVPPAQDDPTPTEEFDVVPSTDEDEQDDLQATGTVTVTATAEPTAVRIENVTVTPVVIFEEELQEEWLLPHNLSRSGASTDPQMVRDSDGQLHVLWRDAIDGFVYSTGSNDDWSPPLAPELPFATRRFFPDLEPEDDTPLFHPTLIADSRGDIHAFWIDTFEDNQTLYHSRVPQGEFADFDAWSTRQSLNAAALKIAVAEDSSGDLHLIFIRSGESAEQPSGIYYRNLDSSEEWSGSVLLYESRYLRGVEQSEANLQILAPENNTLYTVWDDTGKEQLFFTRSTNGGETWDSIQEIDRRSPEDDPDAVGPSQIKVGAKGESVLLTWRAGHEPGQACTQYVMVSLEGGQNWNLRQNVESLPDCLTTSQFVSTGQGLFLMGITEQEGLQRDETISTAYLMVWDGRQWSEARVQEPLSTFTNPDTFQPVRLDCHQAIGEEDQIITIGCDSGNGRDIWLAVRELEVIGLWYPPPPIWQGPETVASSSAEIVDLQLIADDQGGTHAFWHDGQSNEINSAVWNGVNWSAGRPVITAPNGNVQEISAASAGDKLYLVLRDSATGIHFSEAAVSRPSEWSDPVKIGEAHSGAVSPIILAEPGGLVNIAYAVPLNEQRGIYLIQSENAGDTWTFPLTVFDGTSAEWDMVGQPNLTTNGDNQFHVIWSRRTLPPDAQPLALAYSRSDDMGRSWTQAEVIAESPVAWSRIIGLKDRIVHRLWAEDSSERLILWHTYSEDNGLNWSQAAQVTGLSGELLPAVAVDAAEQPHILALENGRLIDFLWDGERWTPGETLEVPFASGGLLAAAGDPQKGLLVVHAGQIPGANEDQEDGSQLFAMSRMLEIPDEQLAPLPTLTPTPPATATPEPTTTPEPTATPVFSTEQERGLIGPIPGLPIGADASASLIILAIIPAGLIVLISLIIGLRIARRR